VAQSLPISFQAVSIWSNNVIINLSLVEDFKLQLINQIKVSMCHKTCMLEHIQWIFFFKIYFYVIKKKSKIVDSLNFCEKVPLENRELLIGMST